MSSVLTKEEEISALNETINDLMSVVYEQANEIQVLSAKELGYKDIIRNLTDQGEMFLKELEEVKEQRNILQQKADWYRPTVSC